MDRICCIILIGCLTCIVVSNPAGDRKGYPPNLKHMWKFCKPFSECHDASDPDATQCKEMFRCCRCCWSLCDPIQSTCFQAALNCVRSCPSCNTINTCFRDYITDHVNDTKLYQHVRHYFSRHVMPCCDRCCKDSKDIASCQRKQCPYCLKDCGNSIVNASESQYWGDEMEPFWPQRFKQSNGKQMG